MTVSRSKTQRSSESSPTSRSDIPQPRWVIADHGVRLPETLEPRARHVPIHPQLHAALTSWLTELTDWPGANARGEPALPPADRRTGGIDDGHDPSRSTPCGGRSLTRKLDAEEMRSVTIR